MAKFSRSHKTEATLYWARTDHGAALARFMLDHGISFFKFNNQWKWVGLPQMQRPQAGYLTGGPLRNSKLPQLVFATLSYNCTWIVGVQLSRIAHHFEVSSERWIEDNCFDWSIIGSPDLHMLDKPELWSCGRVEDWWPEKRKIGSTPPLGIS